MAIESNGIKNNLMKQTSTGTVSQRHSGSNSALTGGTGATLSEGQIVRGEITDLNNHQVTISLSNNESFTAAISDSSSLYIGQTATFRVTDISAGIISLERLAGKYSDGQMATILKALEEADLQKTERNIQIVRDLLEHQMPINKMMLQQMIQQAASYNNISTDTLVIMNKYNMPVNDNTVMQFENMRSGDNSLTDAIDNVSSELPDLLKTLADSAPANLVRQFGSSLINTVNSNIPGYLSTNYSADLSFLSGEEKNLLASFLQESSPDIADKIINGSLNLSDISETIPDMNRQINNSNSGAVTPDANVADNNMHTQSVQDSNSALGAVISKLSAADEYMAYKNHELRSVMDSESREALLKDLEPLNLPKNIISSIKNGTATVEETFSSISETITAAPTSLDNSIASLFSSDRFAMLFKHSINNIWTLTPETVARGSDAISEYYENMLDALKATTALISDNLSGQGSESVSKQTSSMQDNINFMEQLNSIFSYIQLPVKFKDQTIHSELYVYTKKDEVKHHPDRISVLLHLDMEHLGNIDVHIEKHNNQINTVFYCSDNDNAELFRNNISLLTDTLNEKGYLFSASITDRSKKTDIVKEFIETHSSDSSQTGKSQITRYNFDIRA